MMSAQLPCKRILIVDDEERIALGLRDILKIFPDCEIAVANGGEQALRFFEQCPFNLLITDYQMEDMDGLFLASRVRQLHPQTVIIVLTGHYSDALRERANQVSVHCVLSKPASVVEIRAAVSEILNRL
ncbi:MAG: response regulator [Anaerolineae bacterium]|nr:response regulator [Anaerolineae bacterium]